MNKQTFHWLTWTVFWVYCAILMLPNIAWLWFAAGTHSFPKGAPIVAVALTIVWFWLFRKRIWLACLLLAPIALLMPLELYYISLFHLPSSVSVIGTVYASDPSEAKQYVGGMLVPIIATCGASAAIALLASWLAWRARLRWANRATHPVSGIALALLIGLPAISGAAAWHADKHPTARVASAAQSAVGDFDAWVTDGYPFGAPLRIGEFVHYQVAMHREVAKLATFRFGAHLATPLTTRQIYVLVIGESSRRNHWQLFGYHRATNPQLSREANLIPIRHMVSGYPETYGAVPVMITQKPVAVPQNVTWDTPSVVDAMREAGFETWWISNQYAVGPYDSPVAIYAHEAAHLEWLNYSGAGGNGGRVDMDLVPRLQRALRASRGNVFVVLHMMGSHGYSDYRYPPSFRRFTPIESDNRSSVPLWKRTTNSYDNTILYTDHVLASVINVLKRSGDVAALWYESDHGETLPSPTCHESFHGHEEKPDYQIPALFWYSDAYARAFPTRVASMRAHADARVASSDTFASLVDMAGVTFPGHAAHDTRSLFSANWRFHTRWVNQFRLLNFDTAKVTGACMALSPP